jgi:hypothetical protein
LQGSALLSSEHGCGWDAVDEGASLAEAFVAGEDSAPSEPWGAGAEDPQAVTRLAATSKPAKIA